MSFLFVLPFIFLLLHIIVLVYTAWRYPFRKKWRRPRPMTLTYTFDTLHLIDTLHLDDIRPVFSRAFNRWASALPGVLTFTETPTDNASNADILVGFHRGKHGDCQPFENPAPGKKVLLAHAAFPGDAPQSYIHFNAYYKWTVDLEMAEPGGRFMDLETVAMHEIGHVIGMEHSQERTSVVWPYVVFRDRKVDLSEEDVKRVVELYNPRRWRWWLAALCLALWVLAIFGMALNIADYFGGEPLKY